MYLVATLVSLPVPVRVGPNVVVVDFRIVDIAIGVDFAQHFRITHVGA